MGLRPSALLHLVSAGCDDENKKGVQTPRNPAC